VKVSERCNFVRFDCKARKTKIDRPYYYNGHDVCRLFEELK